MHVVVVLGAVVVAIVALAIGAAIVFGAPVLGLASSERRLDHKSKRLLAVSAAAVLLVGVLVAGVVNRSPGRTLTYVGAPATTAPPRTGDDVATSGTTRTTRTTAHRSSGAVTTGPRPSRSSVVRRRSSSTSGAVTALGRTPVTVRKSKARKPTTPTTTKRRTTPTTEAPTTTPTTDPPTTTPTTEPPTTTPTTEPPTTTPTTEPPTTTAPPTLVGDLNADGRVGCSDERILVPQFGDHGSALAGDLNHDGVVDSTDLSILDAHWTGDGTVWIDPPVRICL
jgi:hypothetical protein